MSVVCHLVPGRRPPSRSCRPRRRQGNRRVGCRTPSRLHHPHRSGLRCGAPPSFDGTVSCRVHPISLLSWASDECRVRHDRDDGAVGTPLCPSCYDYVGAVLHNAFSAELWRRTTIYLGRQLAMSLGISRSQCAKVIRLEHCKVAEFQRRGLVHFHAVVRADGPDGSAPPIDVGLLAEACLASIRSVEIAHARGTIRWGSEVDIQPLCRDERSRRVASYVAKYATKEPAMHPGLLGRILSVSDLKSRGLPPHIAAMVATAWALGADPLYRDLGLAAACPPPWLQRPLPDQVPRVFDDVRCPPTGQGRLAPTRGVRRAARPG